MLKSEQVMCEKNFMHCFFGQKKSFWNLLYYVILILNIGQMEDIILNF